jgi:3-methylcrotonyl-CoA carboxylase alpha subunit
MIAALEEYVILGCASGIAFLGDVLRHEAFARGDTHTHFIEEYFASWQPSQEKLDLAAIAAAIVASAKPASSQRRGGDTGNSAGNSPWTTLGGWRIGGARQ